MSTQVIDFNNVENVVFEDKEVETLKLNDIVIWQRFKKLAQLVDKTIEIVTAEDLDGITEIRPYAFYNCLNLANVTLADSLLTLGTSAFNYCPLTEITIPINVTAIGASCFQHCSSLETIKFLGTTPPTIWASAFPFSRITRCEVPAQSLDNYKSSIPDLAKVMVGV